MKHCLATCNAIWVFQMSVNRQFPNFHLFSKILILPETILGKYEDICGRNDLLKQPKQMLISSFNLTNGTFIAPFSPFTCILDYSVQKCIDFTPRKLFNSFVEAVVDARQAGDENPLSGVIAERINLQGNKSYGHQIMDRSKLTMAN